MSRIDKAIEMAAGVKVSDASSPKIAAENVDPVPPRKMPRAAVNAGNNLLVAVNNPHSEVAEEYNKLSALVEQLSKNEKRINTLLITSAVAGEGKTLTAANLALTMARTGEQMVLLVDSDLRRPSLGSLLNIDTGTGLAHCLRDNLPIERALTKVGQGKLAILSAGQKVDDPLELLSSNRMQRFLDELKDRYTDCYCIFDSPPVLPFADARVMGALMDGTIFVARENYSRLNQVKEGLGYLRGCEVLGVLCNDSSKSVGSKYGHYYQ